MVFQHIARLDRVAALEPEAEEPESEEKSRVGRRRPPVRIQSPILRNPFIRHIR